MLCLILLHRPRFHSISYTASSIPQIIASIIQSRAECIYWARGENNLHKLSESRSLRCSLSLRCPYLMRLGLGLLRV